MGVAYFVFFISMKVAASALMINLIGTLIHVVLSLIVVKGFDQGYHALFLCLVSSKVLNLVLCPAEVYRLSKSKAEFKEARSVPFFACTTVTNLGP